MRGILSRLDRGASLHQLTGYSQLQNLPALCHAIKDRQIDSFTECGRSVDTSPDFLIVIRAIARSARFRGSRLPRHEGNKMKGGVRPTMRHTMIALALAGGVMAALDPVTARALTSAERPERPRANSHPSGYRPPAHRFRSDPIDHPANDLNTHALAVPPDLDQRRRDGHMTPEERRLLRQHIEDAVRELYKR
jgi:hypothetical protein